MHSDIPEPYPLGGKGAGPSGAGGEQVEVGCSLDYALIQPVQCQCSVALKNRFKDFFYDRPSRLIALPGPHRQLLVLKEHNPYVTQLLQRLNSNPVNTLNLNEWLSDPTGRLAQLIQPINCTYQNARAFLTFPQALWKAGLVPAPGSIKPSESDEKRTVVLIAGAGFLEIWRYDTWSQSTFGDLLPRFWQELLTSEE
jgi:hypothetical protein